MTVTISEAGGGQWMLTITDGDGASLASTGPYVNRRDAQSAADRIVAGFGSGTVVAR
jgi:hypothetical protein